MLYPSKWKNQISRAISFLGPGKDFAPLDCKSCKSNIKNHSFWHSWWNCQSFPTERFVIGSPWLICKLLSAQTSKWDINSLQPRLSLFLQLLLHFSRQTMLVKGLQAIAAINTTLSAMTTKHWGKELVSTITWKRISLKSNSSIHSPTFYVVPIAYNLGYENPQKQQGSTYYWLVQSTEVNGSCFENHTILKCYLFGFLMDLFPTCLWGNPGYQIFNTCNAFASLLCHSFSLRLTAFLTFHALNTRNLHLTFQNSDRNNNPKWDVYPIYTTLIRKTTKKKQTQSRTTIQI